MQAHRVCRPAARAQEVAVDLHRRELTTELEHERVHALVRDEEVRAETDRGDREAAAQELFDFRHRRGLRELPRRSARAERRVPREIRHKRIHDAVDVPGAEGEDRVAGTRPRGDDPRRILERRRPADAHARTHARELVHDQTAGDARDRLFPRRIDVGHADRVGRGERHGELVREIARARVQMGLEEREHAAAVPHRRDVGGELGGMVRVAVEDALTPSLQPAADAGELHDHALGAPDAGELERRERGGGVAPVVLAGNREHEVDRFELLGAHDVRHLGEPRLEQVLDLGERGERRVVVEVDVEEHGDLRAQRCDGAVGLVALDDQPSLSRSRVPAELRNVPADEERGIEAEPVETECDHRARRRLAVRSGDDDRGAQRDELCEQRRARPPRDATRERSRDVHLPPVRRLRRLRRDCDVDPGQVREVRRVDAIPAGHLRTPCSREQRVRAHAGAADAGDPDAPTGERLRARRAHRRSSRLHRAARRRASRPPSRRASPGRRAATRRAAGHGRSPPPKR